MEYESTSNCIVYHDRVTPLYYAYIELFRTSLASFKPFIPYSIVFVRAPPMFVEQFFVGQ